MHYSDLRKYVDGQPRGTLARMARSLGVSRVYLSQIVARQDGRTPSPALAVRIERETGGKVSRRALRPDDWAELWPELADKQPFAGADACAAP